MTATIKLEKKGYAVKEAIPVWAEIKNLSTRRICSTHVSLIQVSPDNIYSYCRLLGLGLQILAHQIGIYVVFTHGPVPACGKDIKRTAARRQHAGHMSIRDVIVRVKLRHHVTSQRIQDILEVFFMFSNIK